MNAQRRNPLGCLLACGAVVVGGIIVLLVGVVIWIMLGSSPMFDDSEDPRFDNPVTFDPGGDAGEDGESDDDSDGGDPDGDGSGGEDSEAARPAAGGMTAGRSARRVDSARR